MARMHIKHHKLEAGDPRIVYLATSGEYSDYRVDGAFSTLEAAEKCAKQYGGGVEEWQIDLVVDHPVGHSLFSLFMERDGTAVAVYEEEYPTLDQFLYPSDRPYFVGNSNKDGVCVRLFGMWAKDRRHAVKIANEKRARLIAGNHWPPDSEIPYVEGERGGARTIPYPDGDEFR